MSTQSPAAPGDLETVRAFVNSRDLEAGTDELVTPTRLRDWLSVHGLAVDGRRATRDDLARAQAVREALREAMVHNHDRGPISPEAVATLNDAAERGGVGVLLQPDGRWRPRPAAGGVDGALGRLVAIVVEAMGGGEWSRLKVCANDRCQWSFYDHSRARTGRWCSMQVCGNRAKQQRWRGRHEEGGQPSG